MRFLLPLLILSFGLVKSQVLWQFSEDTLTEWSYVFGDEFSQKFVDEEKWIKGFPWGRAMVSQSNYVLPANFKNESGKLDMVAMPLDSLIGLSQYELDTHAIRERAIQLFDGSKMKFQYSTALLWSKPQFQYGYFEIKFKGVQGQGIWPAFWLYGGNPNYEIDFFELKGEKEQFFHVDVHCPEGCANYKEGWFGYRRGWGHWIKADRFLSDSYNIVSGEWSPAGIRWYLNGELAAVSDQKMELPMSLIIGTGVAQDNGPFSPGANKNTPFPNVFSVDYVRVYRNGTPSTETVANALELASPTTFDASVSKTKRVTKGQKKSTVTISICRDRNVLVFRCLGLQNNQTAHLYVTQNGNTIYEQAINGNSEFPLKTNDLEKITLIIEALGKRAIYNVD